jgi:hypothetical protein
LISPEKLAAAAAPPPNAALVIAAIVTAAPSTKVLRSIIRSLLDGGLVSIEHRRVVRRPVVVQLAPCAARNRVGSRNIAVTATRNIN